MTVDVKSVRYAHSDFAALPATTQTILDSVTQTAALALAAPRAMIALVTGDQCSIIASFGPSGHADLRLVELLCQHVRDNGMVFLSNDTYRDLDTPERGSALDESRPSFDAGVPIRLGDQMPAGALCIFAATQAPLADRERQVLMQLADVAGKMLNAHLLTERHARQHRLAAELGQKALANTNLDEILDAAVEAICSGLDVEFSRAMQLDAAGAALIYKAGRGWRPEWIGRRLPISDGEARKRYDLHLQTNQPIVIDDLRKESRFAPSPMISSHNVVSAVELIVQGPSGIFGFLGAYSTKPAAFAAEEVSFMRSIGTILGTAVERAQSEQQLRYLAQFDTLTGLPNQNLTHDRIAQALTQARRSNWHACLMYIDIDRFKPINDVYGRTFGDALLLSVSQRLKDSVDGAETIGRLGRDEFVVVLSNAISANDANLIARRILDRLASPFLVDNNETFLTASIGIAMFPGDGTEARELLKNAHTATSRAKEHGGNMIEFYTAALNMRLTRYINLERDLRRALDRDEFELYYQPQISFNANRIVAAEALLRWRHPRHGLLMPGDFIGVAEESGLILPIGQWVVDTACRKSAQWYRDGHHELTVALNVSSREIRRGDVHSHIRTAIEREGTIARNLEIEVTESMVMDGSDSFITTLRALKEIGVSIAIDDFGTGYSNLTYLKRFPIDTLKIDQSFVRDIVTDSDDAAIVRAIIAMAQQLRLEIIAEGVETESQARFLQRSQVDVMQGFLFAPALPVAKFEDLLKEDRSGHSAADQPAASASVLLVDKEKLLRTRRSYLRDAR